ncbi:hypothetical protein DMH88_11865 [Escherichia coli]|nr:hypothetical protein [Escherichia coli]
MSEFSTDRHKPNWAVATGYPEFISDSYAVAFCTMTFVKVRQEVALTTSCRFARAYRSRTNLITKHSSPDLFYQ